MIINTTIYIADRNIYIYIADRPQGPSPCSMSSVTSIGSGPITAPMTVVMHGCLKPFSLSLSL